MTEYLGEIRMFAGNYAPRGWALCDGSVLPISDNQALWAIIGTTFGGDGVNNFALPDLGGRGPVHARPGPGMTGGYTLGERGGAETVTLTAGNLAVHGLPATNADRTHIVPTSASALARGGAYNTVANTSLRPVGGSQPHENMGPYLVISFIIALQGIFPSRS